MGKFVYGLGDVLKWIGAAALAGMMVLTCADVIMRLMGRPILGAVEIVGFLATITLAGSLPHTHVMRGHAAVDMLIRRFPRPVRRGVDTCTGLLSLALFVVISRQTWLYAESLRASGEVSMTLEFPTYIFVYCVSAAFAVLGLTVLVEVAAGFGKAAGK